MRVREVHRRWRRGCERDGRCGRKRGAPDAILARKGQSAGSSRTHVIQNGRRGDAAHDRPGAHDGCGVRELSPIMLAAREGSPKLRRRRSRRRQRAESAVVGRGREWRRRHYGQERRHRRMCRGRHGDDPVQESSSHRSQTTSTFGRQISSQPKQRPHRFAAAGPAVRVQRESTSEREMGPHPRAHSRNWAPSKRKSVSPSFFSNFREFCVCFKPN